MKETREGIQSASKPIDDNAIAGIDNIFTGFAEWYRANYDEQGKYIGNSLPSLKILVSDEQQDKEQEPC